MSSSKIVKSNNHSLTFDTLEIGNIVEFATKSSQTGLTETKITKNNITTIHRYGQIKMFPPSMIVLEVVQEELKTAHLIDESTGLKKKDSVKVRCQWYSDKSGKFNDRWFNIGVLLKSAVQEADIIPTLNQCVSLKTLAVANKFTTSILRNAIKEEQGEIKYSITKKYDNLFFLPPTMYVLSIENLLEKEKKPIFHKSIEKTRIRKLSDKKVKCMWFDHVSGKFSEHYFSPESLMISEVEDNVEL